MQSKDRLSISTIKLIKHYCFNNIKECYERHALQLNMALTTFYKAMEGDYLSTELIQKIEAFSASLVTSANEVTRFDILEDLVKKIDVFIQSEKMSDWLEVKEWVQKYKKALDKTSYRIDDNAL